MTRPTYGRYCDEVIIQADLLRELLKAPTCR
jgi:hypothetical protein